MKENAVCSKYLRFIKRFLSITNIRKICRDGCVSAVYTNFVLISTGGTCLRRKSHWMLGCRLADNWMGETPVLLRHAFRIGCVQPDFNCFSYLKGSRSAECMKGHNYPNAYAFIQKVCGELSQRERWSIRSYYRFGKLIHYICDAFTHPHNEHFPGDLKAHVLYEHALQHYFLKQLSEQGIRSWSHRLDSLFSVVEAAHAQYMQEPGGMQTDTVYALSVAGALTEMALPKPIPACRFAFPPGA